MAPPKIEIQIRKNIAVTMSWKSGCVYFLTSGHALIPIKIGRTLDMVKRPQNLQTGNPEKLTVISVLQTSEYIKLEKDLHYLFDSTRRQGSEWFDISVDDIHHISKIWDDMMILDDEDDRQRCNRFIGLIKHELGPKLVSPPKSLPPEVSS